jgi:hypothetical protein
MLMQQLPGHLPRYLLRQHQELPPFLVLGEMGFRQTDRLFLMVSDLHI